MEQSAWILDTLRSELPSFFHMGIRMNAMGGLDFDDEAKKELEKLIERLSSELREKEQSNPHSIKVSELSEEIVEQQAEVLEEGGKLKWAKRLRKRFSRRVEKKLKKEDKVELKKEMSRYSYIVPIEYIDDNINRQVYPISLIIWSKDTLKTVLHSFKERSNYVRWGNSSH